MENNEKSKIKKFKDILYSRQSKFSDYQRRKLREKADPNLPEQWQEENDVFSQSREDLYSVQEQKKTSFVFLLIFSIIFFVGAISYAFFFLVLQQADIKQKIDISIVGPNTVDSGESFKFTVKLNNNTELDFENIQLDIRYPDSTIMVDSGEITTNETIKIDGQLLAGGQASENFNVILSGAVGDQRDIEISVIYNAVDFSNLIDETKIYELGIDSAPVSLNVQQPQKTLSSQEFVVNLDILSNTNIILPELLIYADLPQGFAVKEFSMEPILINASSAFFRITDLKPGEQDSLQITGSLTGQAGEDKAFTFEAGEPDQLETRIRTLFARAQQSTTISYSDLQLDVVVGGNYGEEHIVQAGDAIDLELLLRNNLDSVISDIKVEATLEGNNFDSQQLSVGHGYYDSNKDVITWDENTWGSLKTLSGRQQIVDKISLTIKDLESLAGYYTNPEVKLNFKVTGTNFDNPESPGEVSTEFSTLIKTATDIVLESYTVFSIGPLENEGEIPPQVGERTTYTAVWRLFNSTNLLEDVEVRAPLPYHVEFVDQISPADYYLSFDEDTREVVWQVKKLEPYIGYRTPPRTVYFQVAVTPSANQVGSSLELIGPKTVRATDTFIESQITTRQNQGDLNDIKGDPLTSYDIGVVQPVE